MSEITSPFKDPTNARRWILCVAAFIGFGFLMSIRGEFASMWTRAGVAGLAAVILVAGVGQMRGRTKAK